MSFGFISKQNIRNSIKGAENTPATSSYLGTVRADGTTILVNSIGTISVDFTSVNSSIANLSSVSATNIANLSSVTTSSIAYLSSVASTKATTSIFGVARANNTSITINNGTLSLGSSITAAWTIQQVGNGLVFYYGGTPVVQFSSTGAITTISDITGFGTVNG